MDCFLELPEVAVEDLADEIFALEDLVNQISLIEPVKPSERVRSAFEHMEGMAKEKGAFSFASIARLHELIGKDGKLRERPDSFFSEENIAIRGYHSAPAEDLKEILATYFTKYHPNQAFSHPFVKIAGAYLTFELIHPFRDGNGRIGRLIACWLMHAHGYGALAPYLEDWLGNENRAHGSLFESEIRNYLAWCNPSFRHYLDWYVHRFFKAFLQELIDKSRCHLSSQNAGNPTE